MAASEQWVPTIDDLRVKLCYICREEEQHDKPEDPPRAWTHPCSCTLIAHESCLLQWIKSAQQDPARNGNALKCPQCGATYELESDNPRILRLLNAVNASLSTVGKVAAVMGFVALTCSVGFTVYVVSTSYGAIAVKEFLGEEMFNILLTDDPANWPVHAFIHLPTIPFTLILARTRLFDSFPLIIPLFLAWPSSPPIGSPTNKYGGFFTANSSKAPALPPLLNWPPTPVMAFFLYPLVKVMYRRGLRRLTRWVMGTEPSPTNQQVRRVVWALNDGGAAPLRVRIGANIEPAAPAANANANPVPNGNAPRPAGDGEDLPDDPALVAERTMRVTNASLGRFIGGALLIPAIASRMGSVLFRLSKSSPLLRWFLGIKDHYPAQGYRPLKLFDIQPGSQWGVFHKFGQGLQAGFSILAGGTPSWNEHDPVWWRNTVGLGLFVVAKDCLELLHLWLTKRELESRKVKSRSFAGVEIKSLDLIPRPGVGGPSATSAETGAVASTSGQS